MVLTEEQIIKFQALYKDHFSREIGREEAHEKGIKLIRLIELVYKPMTIKEHDQLQDRRREIINKISK